MPRGPRIAPGGYVFHVINRGVNRQTIFDKPEDYRAFEEIVTRTLLASPMRLCAYCLMPNHWHLVLWPHNNGDLAAFMQRLTITHVRRWQEHHDAVGFGHLYQGRYKSFPVQLDSHFFTLVRYAEQNALRAKMVRRAEDWPYSSLWHRLHPGQDPQIVLSQWPVAVPDHWLTLVNQVLPKVDLHALRTSIHRGRPLGSARWQQQAARKLGLESTLRSVGRPVRSV